MFLKNKKKLKGWTSQFSSCGGIELHVCYVEFSLRVFVFWTYYF